MQLGLQKGIAVTIALVLVAFFFSGEVLDWDSQSASVGDVSEVAGE